MRVGALGLDGNPRVFRIPMRLKFRRVTFREGALLRGATGMGRVPALPRVLRWKGSWRSGARP